MKWALNFTYLILFNCFIIFLQEVYQLLKNGVKQYFDNIWNIVDLLPVFTASITMALYVEESYTDIDSPAGSEEELRRNLRARAGGANDRSEDGSPDTDPEQELTLGSVMTHIRVTLQVVTALLLWYKLLKFLRINKNFAYLIRMIAMVVSDMSPFLVVFTVLLIAFADAFFSESTTTPICKEKPDEERCLPTFFSAVVHSYTTALGEFDTFPAWSWTAWLLFLICTIFNLIVMLNLLIAIIGDTYGRVSNTKHLHATRELCGVITDCRDFDLFKRVTPRPCSYLFTAVYKKEETTADKDLFDVHRAVHGLKEQLGNISEQLQASNKEALVPQEQLDKLKTQYETRGDRPSNADKKGLPSMNSATVQFQVSSPVKDALNIGAYKR